MTTRTVHFDKGFPELGPELDLDWRIWLAQHSLPDPLHISARTDLVCDDTARTVTYLRLIRDDKGISILDPEHPNEVLKEWVTVQLEASVATPRRLPDRR